MRVLRSVFVLTTVVFLAAAAAPVFAASQLTYQIDGKTVAIQWPAGVFPIQYTVSQELLARVQQDMIEQGVNAWTDAAQSVVTFRYGGESNAASVRDGKNQIGLTNELFADSGFIAYTTTWFNDEGTIEEADIQVDPKAIRDGYDLRGLIRHEVGHLLGLDHSAIVAATMYPYLDGASGPMDSDDRLAIASLYPRRSPSSVDLGVIRGSLRDDKGPLFGAQVVAVSEDGRTTASALVDRNGKFAISGLPTGNYRAYVEPLDGPVDFTNFSGIYREAGTSSFRTQFIAPAIAVNSTTATELGDIHVPSIAPTVNPRWAGAFNPDAGQVSLTTSVTRVFAGTRVAIAVGGDGFLGGVTTFQISSPQFRRVSELRYGANYVWAIFEIAVDTPEGSVAIMVDSSGEMAALSGALRVEHKVRRRGVR